MAEKMNKNILQKVVNILVKNSLKRSKKLQKKIGKN